MECSKIEDAKSVFSVRRIVWWSPSDEASEGLKDPFSGSFYSILKLEMFRNVNDLPRVISRFAECSSVGGRVWRPPMVACSSTAERGCEEVTDPDWLLMRTLVFWRFSRWSNSLKVASPFLVPQRNWIRVSALWAPTLKIGYSCDLGYAWSWILGVFTDCYEKIKKKSPIQLRSGQWIESV